MEVSTSAEKFRAQSWKLLSQALKNRSEAWKHLDQGKKIPSYRLETSRDYFIFQFETIQSDKDFIMGA